MNWPAAVLLVIACGVVALWWLCRYLARQDADEAHRNLARLVVEQIVNEEDDANRQISDNLDV